MIWLERFIFTIWLSKRGGTFQRFFSRKMNSLKIKHLKKIHFFQSLNMAIWQASRSTVIDSGIRGIAFWNRGFKFLVLEKVEDLIEASNAVRSLPFHSSVCSAHESLKFFFFIVLSCTQKFRNSSRTGEWLIKNFGWGKETTALLITKNHLRKRLFSLSIRIWSKWTF